MKKIPILRRIIMKLKRILAAAMVAGSVMAATVSVYANNSDDSDLPTEYVSSTQNTYTEYRDKYDASYNYINNEIGLQLRVITYSQSGTNCTKKSSAVIPGNSKRFITNYVYEWGYRNCRLYIRADISGSSGKLKGKWSPDSLGSYIVANP